MAALGGSCLYPSPAYDATPGAASTLVMVPWTPFQLGNATAPPGDDGSGIAGMTPLATPTGGAKMGQLWPRSTNAGAQVRTTTSFTTASLAAGASETGTPSAPITGQVWAPRQAMRGGE